MDWGIVASVLVGLALFALGMGVIGISICVPMMRRMRRTMEAGEIPTCPMPGCPFHKEIEGALTAATRSGQESGFRHGS